MKAAVLHQFGSLPGYEEFVDPNVGEGEIRVTVKAVALENVDRMMASGEHYATGQFLPSLPAVLGMDGVGALDDGRLVGFYVSTPPFGSMAEFAVVQAAHVVPIPDGVDALTAAAAPSSTLSALLPLKFLARLQPGETVLINGATGFAGRLAVQVAKHLGAGRVVGSGRDAESLRTLPDLGADAVIDLKQGDDAVLTAYREAAGDGYDVIVDFLWGRPTELLIRTLVPTTLSFARRRVGLIQMGQAAGADISLPAEALRTSGLEITGAGNIRPEDMAEATALMWDLLQTGALKADIEAVPLADIESVWARSDVHGKRLVIVP